MTDATIILANGCKWYPFDPNRAIKHVNDDVIATHLSRICRYGGAVWLSVAEHSVLVSRIVEDWLDDERMPECRVAPERRSNLLLSALLHDAHEALSGWGDIQSPVKQSFDMEPILWLYEKAIDRSIVRRFGLDDLDSSEERMIKQADHAARLFELFSLAGRNISDRDTLGPAIVAWCEARCLSYAFGDRTTGLLPDAARQLFLDHWCCVDKGGGSA